jgi:hypothetical protein
MINVCAIRLTRNIETRNLMKQTSNVLSGVWRSRWAAVGAAVAVTLGAGGLAMVNAADSAPSSFVAITPARILDTRTDVGLAGPFTSGVAQLLQVTGSVPTQPPENAPAVTKTVVPTNATAVMLNLTILKPTTLGFISIRPGDATGIPATSNNNFSADGEKVKANAVTVQLPANGKINIFVEGTIGEALVDVVGYFVPAQAASGVTTQAFEVMMDFDSTQVIADNGDLNLSLRCRADDQTPDQDFSATNRNNMQFRAYSLGKYMTTYVDAQGLYENEGVTIARALGGSTAGEPNQTTFVTRDGVRTAATMTAADGRQITVDGDSVQVMFNVTDPAINGGATVDCYARGFATLLPAR